MFYDPPGSQNCAEFNKPMYFKFIEQKLEDGMYMSLLDFIYDVRTIFHNVEKSTGFSEYKKLGSRLLLEKFERMIDDGFIINSQIDDEMFKISHFLSKQMKMINTSNAQTHPKDSIPAAGILKEEVDIPSTKQLQAELRILNDPNLIIQAAIFAYEKQKGCVTFGQTVDFHFRKMSNKTKQELHKFIISKLKKIALE